MSPVNFNRSAIALLGAAVLMTTSAHAQAPLARTIELSYERGELSRPEAVEALYGRIRRAAREEGMRFLRESALDKVRLGMTTLKEINKVTFIEAMR